MLLSTYEYYSETFMGSSISDESLFDEEITKASRIVNRLTRNRITELTDDIQNTACEVMELRYSQEMLKAKMLSDNDVAKSSESVGPHSVSYVDKTSMQNEYVYSDEELEYQYYKICMRYLGHTGLMYRGVY